LVALEGTYVRRHLHRCWDTTALNALAITFTGRISPTGN
jgi:hypothetical protein